MSDEKKALVSDEKKLSVCENNVAAFSCCGKMSKYFHLAIEPCFKRGKFLSRIASAAHRQINIAN